jgi:hypothetical protein
MRPSDDSRRTETRTRSDTTIAPRRQGNRLERRCIPLLCQRRRVSSVAAAMTPATPRQQTVARITCHGLRAPISASGSRRPRASHGNRPPPSALPCQRRGRAAARALMPICLPCVRKGSASSHGLTSHRKGTANGRGVASRRPAARLGTDVLFYGHHGNSVADACAPAPLLACGFSGIQQRGQPSRRTAHENWARAEAPAASTAVTVTEYIPARAVPLIRPVLELIDRPVGSPVADQL